MINTCFWCLTKVHESIVFDYYIIEAYYGRGVRRSGAAVVSAFQRRLQSVAHQRECDICQLPRFQFGHQFAQAVVDFATGRRLVVAISAAFGVSIIAWVAASLAVDLSSLPAQTAKQLKKLHEHHNEEIHELKEQIDEHEVRTRPLRWWTWCAHPLRWWIW